jgi:quinol monooxygenase YgiN
MAVTVTVEIPGVNAAQYDAIIKDAIPNGRLAEGCRFHVAGPMEDGWRVVDVWDSQESFDTFAQSTLAAAFKKNGIQAQPKISSGQVHNMALGR